MLSLTLRLAILLGGAQALSLEASNAAMPRESDGSPLAIVIRHIGEQDRAIPRLALYSGNRRVLARQLDCARSTACFWISAGVLARLTRSLDSFFSSQVHDDADVEQAGSFRFSIESHRTQKALRMNRRHSFEIFRELIELVKEPAIRRQLEWRLSITRI